MYSYEKGPQVKYHGLKNQGATCYLNSVLQVLFMTEDFRAAVKRDNSKNPDTEFIDHHLTTLFDDLQERSSSTNKIIHKLGINGVYEQRDAAEYFEKILSLTSPDASQIFHGQLTHKTICSTCGTETDTDGPFWHLPLALVDSYNECYSVVNGIEEYFKDADFSGENQMYCDQCDDKSDATIKCVVKHHPEVLMLLLKRFEFNYSYMTYVKNNCTVEVPDTLEIPENQRYELYAVVDHFGDLRSGHYTATIKSQDDGRWYTFNDDRVTLLNNEPFQLDNLVRHCQKDVSARSDGAYLLFYRKVNVHAEDTCNQDIREMSSPGDLPSDASDNNDQHKVAGKMRGIEESEGAEQASNDVAASVSINGNVETGTEGLSPDPRSSVESQHSMPPDSQESKEERTDSSYYPQDAHDERQRNEGKIIMNGKEDMRGKAEADDRDKKRENLSKENPLKESVEDQDNDSKRQKTPEIHFEPTVSDRHVIQGHPNKQDEMSEEQRRVMDVKTEKVGKTGDDEESEKKGKSGRKYPDKDSEYQDQAGLGDNRNENLGGSQEVGQHYALKPVGVDEQGDWKRMEKVDKEGKTGANERGKELERPKLFTKLDLCCERVSDDKQNMSEYDESCKEGNGSRCEGQEKQRGEKSDDQEVKEQKRGDDKHTQRKVTSERQQDCGQDGDQSNTGLDDITHNRLERKISPTHTRHEDVSVVRNTREQQNKRDEGIQSGPQRSTEVKCTIKENFKEKEGNIKGTSDPKKNPEEDSLSKPFSNLSLSESRLPEQQKRRTKGKGNAKEEIETNSTLQSSARKRQKESDTQIGADDDTERKRKRKRSWFCFLPRNQQRKKKDKKNKKNKTTGCSFLPKRRKRSESD